MMKNRSHATGFRIAALLKWCIAALLLSGVVINFANVVARNVFASPFPWGEEVLTYLLVWIVFLGVGAVAWEGKHLRVDVFELMLPRGPRILISGLSAVATTGVSIFVLVQSSRMVALYLANDQVSLVTEIPMEVPHSAVPIGFSLMIALLLLRFFSRGADR